MIITKIEKQKKDKQRYSIFLGGEFAFGLYEDTVLKYGLRTGDEIDEKKQKEIMEYDEFNFGKKVAYSLLSYKQRTALELIKKLKQKKISEGVIEKIIKLLQEQKYLNDEAYAKNYLLDKLARKPLGKRLLKFKLIEKGVGKEITEKTIKENYTEEKETKLAAEVLKKYRKKIKDKDSYEVKNKCYRYLVSKGYDFEIVNKVLKIEEEE